ncbi:MAG: VCBS repeat-containing protein [Ferruginibacter sp.]|nr:VCBS repeat-containing protein [Cytophagales bacterium]
MVTTQLRVLLLVGSALLGTSGHAQPTDSVRFKKHTLTTDFVAEGVTVGDVNKDGRVDVMAGTYWFEAPNWKRHELAKGETFSVTSYSNTFLNYSLDVNRDGWIDVIRIGYPGQAAMWYENPKNRAGYWKAHLVYPSVGNESPALLDLDGDGNQDLICADSQNKKIVWVSPPSGKDTSWTAHTISSDSLQGTHMYTHGLGLGDINLDGRADVVTREGWWEAPVNRKQPNWPFHRVSLGEECSQMYILDLDGDRDQDVVSASAHDYGIWWHEGVKNGAELSWKQHEISKTFSQTHGMALVDINGDNHPDLVTGKRYYAHNGKDPGAEEPSVLYWFEYKPGKKPAWVPHQIDDNSGVGLHLVTQDITRDKLVDIIIGNKKGVFVFEQVKR